MSRKHFNVSETHEMRTTRRIRFESVLKVLFTRVYIKKNNFYTFYASRAADKRIHARRARYFNVFFLM